MKNLIAKIDVHDYEKLFCGKNAKIDKLPEFEPCTAKQPDSNCYADKSFRYIRV